jgi:hypothetical protein
MIFNVAIDGPISASNGKENNVFTSNAISVVVEYYREAIRIKFTFQIYLLRLPLNLTTLKHIILGVSAALRYWILNAMMCRTQEDVPFLRSFVANLCNM